MPQIINSNIASMSAQRNLNKAQSSMETAMSRLSSGMRINSAKDDAAGSAIATRFDAQTRGMSVAMRNAGDGVSMAQTAEGALDNIVTNLQRMRELALQSANATNSDLDRAALNAEAKQLVDEIERVGDTTNFNGIKLLSGEFTEKTFQIGANNGETFSFSISAANTTSLGMGAVNGASGQGNSAALGANDLKINNIAVGASNSVDDQGSTTFASSSSIAKAAAINSVSAETGVIATADANHAEGADMTAATLSGTITINDVEISVSTGGVDTAIDRQTVTAAINSKSDQTGVQAVDSKDAATGVVLVAADGRNIEVAMSTMTAAASGVSTGVSYGSFTLQSTDGADIDITGGSGTLSNSGLVETTYRDGVASVGSQAQTAGAALGSTDLVINDVAIAASKASDDAASFTSANQSAISKAAAINLSSGDTGVQAVVNENVVEGVADTAAALTGNMVINGVTTGSVTLSGTDGAGNRTLVANAINAISGQTGVRAEDTISKGVKLTAADGRNVTVAFSTLTSAATGVNAADTYIGTYNLESAGQIKVESGGGTLTNSGLTAGVYGGSTSGQFIRDVDISTVDGATKAIEAVDNALQSINDSRAKLGAVQNRLNSTISSIEVNKENLTAAKSRITDTDFASTTAELSRAQVLQQAGMSMLSQANSGPQSVLALLR